ncbi:hypothetical protein KM043_014198 [Ampulex compressa]|nr:hypothetical protein KM043_014198 [Ampulex compressa]
MNSLASTFSCEENFRDNLSAVSQYDAKHVYSKNNTTHSIIDQKECISTYFKEQKKNPCLIDKKILMDKKLHMPEKKPGFLKEKLLNARASENNTLLQTDCDVDVEMMAYNNKLGEVKLSVLSAWLKKHHIPHNGHGKKIDLITKVLSHIRNTQRLSQFRA